MNTLSNIARISREYYGAFVSYNLRSVTCPFGHKLVACRFRRLAGRPCDMCGGEIHPSTNHGDYICLKCDGFLICRHCYSGHMQIGWDIIRGFKQPYDRHFVPRCSRGHIYRRSRTGNHRCVDCHTTVSAAWFVPQEHSSGNGYCMTCFRSRMRRHCHKVIHTRSVATSCEICKAEGHYSESRMPISVSLVKGSSCANCKCRLRGEYAFSCRRHRLTSRLICSRCRLREYYIVPRVMLYTTDGSLISSGLDYRARPPSNDTSQVVDLRWSDAANVHATEEEVPNEFVSAHEEAIEEPAQPIDSFVQNQPKEEEEVPKAEEVASIIDPSTAVEMLTCTICMDRLKDTRLGCGHVYCKTCVFGGNGGNVLLKCPICRANITQIGSIYY